MEEGVYPFGVVLLNARPPARMNRSDIPGKTFVLSEIDERHPRLRRYRVRGHADTEMFQGTDGIVTER